MIIHCSTRVAPVRQAAVLQSWAAETTDLSIKITPRKTQPEASAAMASFAGDSSLRSTQRTRSCLEPTGDR